MARANFRVEKGLEIHSENGTSFVAVLQDAGAPLGTSGETDDAPVGSLYLRNDSEGELYHKIADTSSASDWERFADESAYEALGITFDDENMGAYTGGVLTDNETAKENIQELSDAIEAISGGSFESVAIPAATPTTVSECLVDDCNGVEWEVYVYETGSEAVKEYFKLSALHDGTSSADAANFDDSVHTKLKIADISGLSFDPVLTGAAAAQTIGLSISATAAITVKVRRTDIPN